MTGEGRKHMEGDNPHSFTEAVGQKPDVMGISQGHFDPPSA
jgi:hypothetical protein